MAKKEKPHKMAKKEKPYIIGTAAMLKIMEIEGIKLSADDLAFLNEIEGLPDDERGQRILAHIKKK